MATKKDPPLTEAQLVKLLRARYEQDNGNGMAGGLIPAVRDAAGFDARRTIDALGVNYWKSRGLLIDAFECKSSRSDWLRELANPEKADRFCQLADRFWIVAGRADLVLEDEVPPDWGLLVPRGNGLTQIRPAKLLHPDESSSGGRAPRPLPPGFNRSFLIAVLRQALRVSNTSPAEIEQARREGREAGEAHANAMHQNYKQMYDELRGRVNEFQRESGVVIGDARWANQHSPARVGAAVRAVLDGDAQVERLEKRLQQLAVDAEAIARQARARLSETRQADDTIVEAA